MFSPSGTLLTVEQGIRLGMMSKMERDEYIAEIVRHLRERSQGRHGTQKTPRQWYQARRMP